MTKDLEKRCSEAYLYKGQVLCKSKEDCPHKSKLLVPIGERTGISNETYSGISLPKCEVKGYKPLEEEK